MSNDAFEKLVEEGIKAIPEKFLQKLKNVRIVVEDEPSREQIKKIKLQSGRTLFGLYEGVPQPARNGGYNFSLPDKITIFKLSIENACDTDEQIRKQVMQTVWHEIAHHFGLDDDAVRFKEKERRKNKNI